MKKSMLMTRIFLIFLLPACISLNTMSTMEAEDSLPWLQYWTVLAFALVTEYLLWLLEVEGGILKLLKLLFILWCLAPVYYNGSYVVSSFVLLPVHACIHDIVTLVADLFREITAFFYEIFFSLKAGFLSMFVNVIAKTFFDICYHIGCFIWTLLQNILDVLIAIPHKLVEFLFCDLLQSMIPTILSTCHSYANELVSALKSEDVIVEEPANSFELIFDMFKNALGRNNTDLREERLFSKLFKEVIYKPQTKNEEPRLFSQLLKRLLYG